MEGSRSDSSWATGSNHITTFAPVTNQSNSGSDREVQDCFYILAACLLVAICVAGVVGNVFVIIAVTMSRRLQTTTNAFVVMLGCMDLLSSLVLPVQASSLVGALQRSEFFLVCQVMGGLTYVFNGCSIMTLIAIAVNRYALITKPVQLYRRIFSRRNVAIFILLTFAYPILFWIVLFVSAGWVTFGRKACLCEVEEDSGLYILLGITAGLMVVTMFVCYLKISLHVRNHARKTRNQEGSDSNPQASDGEVATKRNDGSKDKGCPRRWDTLEAKITANMLAVIVCFIICVTPITAVKFVSKAEPEALIYSFVVFSLHCCLNPALYAWKHPVFHRVFQCMISGRLRDIEEPTRWLRDR